VEILTSHHDAFVEYEEDEVADKNEADGYTDNAANEVQEAIQMVSRLRELT
jgi:hypothetical protein